MLDLSIQQLYEPSPISRTLTIYLVPTIRSINSSTSPSTPLTTSASTEKTVVRKGCIGLVDARCQKIHANTEDAAAAVAIQPARKFAAEKAGRAASDGRAVLRSGRKCVAEDAGKSEHLLRISIH